MTQQSGIKPLNVGRHLFTFQPIPQLGKAINIVSPSSFCKSDLLNSTKETFLLFCTLNPDFLSHTNIPIFILYKYIGFCELGS